MGKILTANKVKKLPEMTDILFVDESTGKAARLWIMRCGRKKMLKGVLTDPREIKDFPGYHYERVGT